eukprot:scaffold84388_cov16-Tisochrysis_lutea.AAC.1
MENALPAVSAIHIFPLGDEEEPPTLTLSAVLLGKHTLALGLLLQLKLLSGVAYVTLSVAALTREQEGWATKGGSSGGGGSWSIGSACTCAGAPSTAAAYVGGVRRISQQCP